MVEKNKEEKVVTKNNKKLLLLLAIVFLACIGVIKLENYIGEKYFTKLEYKGFITFNNRTLYVYEFKKGLFGSSTKYICAVKIPKNRACIIGDSVLICEDLPPCPRFDRLLFYK